MAAFHTFGPECCKECPLVLQCLAVFLISIMPVSFAVAYSGATVGVCVFAFVLLPRLLWQFDSPSEGTKHLVSLGIYWNMVYAICFLSPLLIAGCCYYAPLQCGPVVALYVVWTQVARHELKDGNAWPWFVRFEWGYHAFRKFLHLRIQVSDSLMKLPPTTPVFLAVHPHGIASDYRIIMDGILYEALPGRQVLVLAASVLFKIPLVRELALWTRCIDASRHVAERAFKRGHSLMVLPGGMREQIRTKYQCEEVFLPSMGFVKLALQGGVPLVPCYVFGCVDMYKTYSFLHGPREWIRKRFRICIPVYSGSIGVLPRRVPLTVVMGEPMTNLACATPGQPTDDEVRIAGIAYVEALKRLFDDHKEEFGYGDRQLHVEFPEAKKN